MRKKLRRRVPKRPPQTLPPPGVADVAALFVVLGQLLRASLPPSVASGTSSETIKGTAHHPKSKAEVID